MLNSLLRNLTKEAEHEQSVETLLRTLDHFRSLQQSQNSLAYTLTVTWYINIVFKEEFRLEYLDTFDHYFVPGIRKTISSTNDYLFDDLIRTLHDSGDLKNYNNDHIIDGIQSLLY